MKRGLHQQNSGQDARMTQLQAVIERLPSGVQYPFVHLILADLPPMTEVALWLNTPSTDEILSAFNRGTYGTVDRLLRRHERALVRLPENAQDTARTDLDFFRHSLAQLLLNEAVAKVRARGDCWIETRLVDPERRGRPSDPCPLSGRGAVITVWQVGRDRRAHRLAIESIAAGPPPWRDARVGPVDSVALDKLHLALLRKYCRPLFRLRVGHEWRTKRAPSGWRVLTQRVIPQLYDYLLPFYPVRRYSAGVEAPGGRYPKRLLRDIRDLLAAERPDLAAGLTREQVQAAIQRHLAKAPPDRPLGKAMFQLYPKAAKVKHTTRPRQ